MKENYITLVLASYVRSKNFDAQVGDRWYFDEDYESIAYNTITAAFKDYGFDVNPAECEDIFGDIFSKIAAENGVIYDGDELAGEWFKFVTDNKNIAVGKILQSNPAQKRVKNIGRPALERALQSIFGNSEKIDGAQFDLIGADASEHEIPASDRIVRLTHNQIAEAEPPVTELIDALEDDNGNPDEPGLRERLIGQLRAARELIRVGEYRAYLMYELLVRALGEIIKKYGNPTIIALANALLGAVVSQLVQA